VLNCHTSPRPTLTPTRRADALVFDLPIATPEGRKAELSWWLVTHRGATPVNPCTKRKCSTLIEHNVLTYAFTTPLLRHILPKR